MSTDDIIIILYTLELNKCKRLHLLQIFIAFHFILNEMLILLLKILAEIMSVVFSFVVAISASLMYRSIFY